MIEEPPPKKNPEHWERPPAWVNANLAMAMNVYAHALGALLGTDPALVVEYWMSIDDRNKRRLTVPLLEQIQEVARHLAEWSDIASAEILADYDWEGKEDDKTNQ